MVVCCRPYFYVREHLHIACLAARPAHLAPDWLLCFFCLVVFVDVVVVVLSLGSYHYPEPPSPPQSPQRDPLGHAH